jgi:hypothetical protein
MFRPTLFLLLILSAATISVAQTVTGSWYGRADVIVRGVNNNYLTELILKQKGNDIEGVFGYYFKDSYQSFFIRGTYNKATREVNINNLPMLFYKSSTRNGIECPMSFEGILRVSKVKNMISGSFYSDEKYKYTCPEMRVSFSLDQEEKNQDSVLQASVTSKKFWKPQEEDFVVTNAANNKPVTITADATATTIHPKEEETSKLMARFSTRKNIYMETLEVEGDSVRVSFYDNGDIDGDSISILLNKQPVLVNQELSARALNIYLSLDTKSSVNEVSMFAENLGKIPPNTALMIVTDGKNRYEVYLSSTLTQNATVRLKRKPKPDPHLLK